MYEQILNIIVAVATAFIQQSQQIQSNLVPLLRSHFKFRFENIPLFFICLNVLTFISRLPNSRLDH